MTRDDIIQMAEQAGLKTGENQKKHDGYYYRSLGTPTNVRESDLIEFARIVAAAKSEACAKMCDERANGENDAQWCADAIRAKGQS